MTERLSQVSLLFSLRGEIFGVSGENHGGFSVSARYEIEDSQLLLIALDVFISRAPQPASDFTSFLHVHPFALKT